MGRPKRHRSRKRLDRVEVLAKDLPPELRSFKRWLYADGGQPTGLRDYLKAVAGWIGRELGTLPAEGAPWVHRQANVSLCQ